MTNKIFVLLLTFLCAATCPQAQVKVKLGGRLFFDGGTFTNAPTGFHPTVGLTDLRLATGITFSEGFYTKVEIGIAKNKLALKDVFIQKDFNDSHYVRAGHTLGTFSLDQFVSTNDYTFHTGANVAETFYPDRRMGLMYTYKPKSHHFSIGVFCGDGLNITNETMPGFNSTIRYVYLPIDDADTHRLHLGLGGLFRIPDKHAATGLRPVSFASKGATYLSVGSVISLTVPDVDNLSQQNAEIIYQRGKFIAKGEYLLMQVTRPGSSTFNAHGGHAEFGFLIRGTRFGYDYVDAMPVRPTDPHSLMIISRINCTDLNDHAAGLTGGRQWDLALGLNYFYSKTFSAKINYTQIWADAHTQTGRRSFGALQARLQVSF